MVFSFVHPSLRSHNNPPLTRCDLKQQHSPSSHHLSMNSSPSIRLAASAV